MALIKCPECGKEISDKARACPNCGFEPRRQQQQRPLQPIDLSKLPDRSKAGMRWFWGIIIAIGIIYFIGKLNDGSSSSQSSNSPSSSSSSTNKFLAYSYAEGFVKQRLKSPSTAEFPGTIEKVDHITELGYNEYKIVSWVDSQNSFGAMMRTKFSCVIRFKGEQVTCEDLQFYE